MGTAVLLATPADGASLSLRALARQDVRLASVAYRLGGANGALCRTPRMMTGAVFHDLTQYAPGMRAAVSQAFALHSGYGVLGTVPGSAADRAGFRIDDEVVAVAGVSVEEPGAIRSGRLSYQRMDRFTALLDRALSGGSTDLTVRRDGRLVRLKLRGQPGCGGAAALTDSAQLNAWSDGRHIVLSTAIANLAPTDDELAFVVAHEMAHNILGHSSGHASKTRAFLAMLGFGSARVKRGELEADEAAVTLMANAGYDGDGAKAFLERVRRRIGWDASLDHPGFGRRIETVSRAMARLRSVRAAPARSIAVLASMPSPASPPIHGIAGVQEFGSFSGALGKGGDPQAMSLLSSR